MPAAFGWRPFFFFWIKDEMSTAPLHQVSLREWYILKESKRRVEEKPKCTFLRRESSITKMWQHPRLGTLKWNSNRRQRRQTQMMLSYRTTIFPYPPLMPTNWRFFFAPLESLFPSFFFMMDFSVFSLFVHTIKKWIEVIKINITRICTKSIGKVCACK